MENFQGAEGELMIDGARVPFAHVWVCGLAADDGPPYHGPLIELRLPDEVTGHAALRRLGWNGDA